MAIATEKQKNSTYTTKNCKKKPKMNRRQNPNNTIWDFLRTKGWGEIPTVLEVGKLWRRQ